MVRLILAMILVLSISGCASTGKTSKSAQIKQLQSQVDELKKDIQQKENQISYLEGQTQGGKVQKAVSPKDSQVREPESDVAPMTSRNIQLALKNAGFYYGSIDGKVGKQTKKAIKDFQEANNLTADGVVGKKTWSKLKGYLD